LTKSSTSPSHPPRYRPLDYSPASTPLSDALQTVAGLGIFFGALYTWRHLSQFLPDDGIRAWVLLGLFGALLVAVDLLARNEWNWDRMRLGMVLGLFAVAGFWIVRIAMWQMGYGSL
jgi:hypothetical protein